MKLEIKHRFSGATLFTCDLPAEVSEQSFGARLGYAIKEAFKARANLAGAYLAGAYLAGAYLAGADLAGANLADADLAGANLAGANLAGAYLARANLAGANLAGADLAGAYLARANLAGAYLAGARNVPQGTEQSDPPEPYVRATKPEHYAKRAERYRQRNPDVPVIPNLDAQILCLIETGKGRLEMSTWHSCETTHCRAGWAVTLAGEAGKKLEREYGPAVAGRMIYLASTGRVPHFYGTNVSALADIKARAAEQTP